MPYPHKNSDGKATLGHDEKGMPKNTLEPPIYSSNHPVYGGKVIANFNQVMENDLAKIKADMAAMKWVDKETGLEPKPGEFGKPTGKTSMAQLGELLKDVYTNGYKFEPEPILIKATGSYKDLYAHKQEIPTSYYHPLKQLRIVTRMDGISEGKKYGFGHALDPYHDYTETEVRQMLMKGFANITEKIIQEMKEKK